VFGLKDDKTLEKVAEIATGYPIDNLSVDRNGDIYAAAFPKAQELLKSSTKPYKVDAAATVRRIRKTKVDDGEDTYQIETVIEDRDAKSLGGVTVVVHDAESGRLFLGGEQTTQFQCVRRTNNITGNFAPYISVCEKI
jgi:arylesterase / paraoxonase